MTDQMEIQYPDRPGIGHNVGPELDDLPEDWTSALRSRAEVLVEQAAAAHVNDEESSQQCLLLAGLIRDHIKQIDKEREETKRPYLAKCREIDNVYKDIEALLVLRDPRQRPVSGPLVEVVGRVDSWRREQERIAAEKRRALEEEARRKREELAAAQRERERQAAEAAAEARKKQEAEDQAAARARRHQQELEDSKRQVEIENLERQAAATVPQPQRNVYGVSAHRRPVYKVAITDLTAALRHARKLNEASLRAVVQQIYEAQVRAGVRELPGATVTADSATTIRTR